MLCRICSTPCNEYALEPETEGDPSPAESFCRTQLGSDDEDLGKVVWACGAATGTCFRSNACTTDADCGAELLCHENVPGATVGETEFFSCLPDCEAEPDACPAGTVCGDGGKCIRGCETDPTQCGADQICQVALSTPAMCTERCDAGFDCATRGEYRCNTETGACEAGCDADEACGSGKVCMVIEVANPDRDNGCFAPCKSTGCSPPACTPCNIFGSRDGSPIFMCDDDSGHCVAAQ